MAKAGLDLSTILDFLNLGAKNFVGLDLGMSSVKLAECIQYKKGNFRLMKFAASPMSEGALLEDEIQKHDDIVESIVNAYSDSGSKNKNVNLGFFGPNTIVKKLQMAAGSDEEIEDQVMWESEQYIPFGVDDSAVSFFTLGDNAGGGKDIVLAAARNDLVETYNLLIEDSELNMKLADLQIIALANMFEYCCNASQMEGMTVLLDFGAQKTNLIIWDKQTFSYAKEINIGGFYITEEIQKSMGLGYTEAEDLKIQGDANGNLPQEILDVVNNNLKSLVSEIKKTVEFYTNQSPDIRADRILITGGASLTPGLTRELERELSTKVEYINPFERMKYNAKQFDEQQLQYIATHGCVAIGLGLRGKES